MNESHTDVMTYEAQVKVTTGTRTLHANESIGREDTEIAEVCFVIKSHHILFIKAAETQCNPEHSDTPMIHVTTCQDLRLKSKKIPRTKYYLF